MVEIPQEPDGGIFRRTLSAASHLFAVYALFFGWSLFWVAPKGEGIHGSRAIGWMSIGLGGLLGLAGWGLWKPRRRAWTWVTLAALGSVALAGLDFSGGRRVSGLVDGAYAPLALGLFLASRPRA
ncbi:MAG TPA: hypothetical protein VEN81_03335 [Planctomycetota bacterium]|nr:hypothetical protein [Planctomycetota bacterium]